MSDQLLDIIEKPLKLRSVIENKSEKLSEYLERSQLPGVSFSDIHCKYSRNPQSKIEKHVLFVDALEKEIASLMNEYNAARDQCAELIGRLDDSRERSVMAAHYVDGVPYWVICEKLHICKKTFYRVRSAALDHLAELISQDNVY